MEHNLCFIILYVIVSLCSSEVHADYCKKSSICAYTCYITVSYTSKCAWVFDCTKYRIEASTCYSLCYSEDCCPGYKGDTCNIPICSQMCSLNGNCTAPDTCTCFKGYRLLPDNRTCEDIDECSQGRITGCQHTCVNTPGSYKCSCNVGFTLDINGKNCTDIDECSQVGASGCQHSCVNTPGSYKCSCNKGFQLDLNGKNCTDIDECKQVGMSVCQHTCSNTPGSYQCSCNKGFQLDINGKDCSDVDECSRNNGGCEQECINKPGTYECNCKEGFEQTPGDPNHCSDINECAEGISGCSQKCQNSDGSFTCICEDGYQLVEDGKTCSKHGDSEYYDDTEYKNGSEDNTDDQADTEGQDDTKEQDNDTEQSNESGQNNEQDQNNSNEDDSNQRDTPECNGFALRYLPEACFTLPFTLRTNEKEYQLELTSTSRWHSKNKDNTIYFTSGISYINVNKLLLPIALTGVEATISRTQVQLRHGVSDDSRKESAKGQESDESVLDQDQSQCQPVELKKSDLSDYISCGAFLKSYFTALLTSLPDWISFEISHDSTLTEQGMKSDLTWGRDIDDIIWCKGAPTFDDHLYSVFQFDNSFSLEVLGQQLHIPKPLSDHKFCMIIDLCKDNGKTMFLMIPEESRNMFKQMKLFRALEKEKNIRLLPRGIGLSLEHGIKVQSQSKLLQIWNGDRMFQYPVFEQANVWLGGEVNVTNENWQIAGRIDAFFNVPRINNLLTSIFHDEWNSYISASTKVQFKFQLFGETYTLDLNQVSPTAIETYMSVGGQNRLWCGEESNPTGFFFSVDMTSNLFSGVEILEDWDISVSQKAYGFVTSKPTAELGTAEISEDVVITFSKLLQNISLEFEEIMEGQEIVFSDTTLQLLGDIINTISELKSTMVKDSGNSFEKQTQNYEKSWVLFIKLNQHIETLFKKTDDSAADSFRKFKQVVKYDLDNLKLNMNNVLSKVSGKMVTTQPNFRGFGLKYMIELNVLGLQFGDFEIEIVYSTDNLFECIRYKKIMEHLKGETAIRFLLGANDVLNLGPFFTSKGVAGGALSEVSYKFVIQLEVSVKILGITMDSDLFITNNGLHLYLEGNVWDIFIAQVNVSAEIGKQWYDLSLNVAGRFLSGRSSFQDSYLEALKKAISFVADAAKDRLSQVQERLTSGQKAFEKAQVCLTEKQAEVKKANILFDQAIAKLEGAKKTLEEAKQPYEAAIAEIASAQKDVNNICKIETCKEVCIPGVKTKCCYGRFFRVKYPCFEMDNCMITIKDKYCEAKNLICQGVRFAAYAALEAANIVGKTALVSFDLAKSAVSLAQVIVDKSRVVLSVAEGVLETAKVGLEFASGVLEAAKLATELVKIAIGAGAKILNSVMITGLQYIIDVRNCGFDVELTTQDLPVFAVFCEVNAFELGWQRISVTVNFKNILQSMWYASRATIDALMKLLGDSFERKRREVSFESSRKLHGVMRNIRSSENLTDSQTLIYQNLDLTNNIFGFGNGTSTDYENRRILFEGKCVKTTKVLQFLQVAFEKLQNIANSSLQTIIELENMKNELEMFAQPGLADNFTFQDAGISQEYALSDYNITAEDLEMLVNQAMTEMSDNPLLREMNDAVNLSIQSLNSQLQAMYEVDFREAWLLALANFSLEYFNTSECVDFQDCVMYATSILYDAFENTDIPDIDISHQTILDVELAFIELFQNKTSKITETSALIDNIVGHVYSLKKTNPFCAKPPYFRSAQSDQTVLVGADVVFLCDAFGDPAPVFWWFRDNILITNERGRKMIISNVSVNDSGKYICLAGNIVANLSSKESHLLVLTHDDDECQVNNGGCEHHCENTVGSFRCYCDEGYAPSFGGKICTGSHAEQEKLRLELNAVIISMSVLGLMFAATAGIAIYYKLGNKKISKVGTVLPEKYNGLFRDGITPVEEISRGSMDTVYRTKKHFPIVGYPDERKKFPHGVYPYDI